MSDQPVKVPEDFWQAVDDNVTKENQGGGGWWCGFSTVFCYHVTPPENSGIPKSKQFFEYDPTVKETKTAAMERAKKFVVEVGSDKRVYAGVMTHIRKENFLDPAKRDRMDEDEYFYFVPGFPAKVDAATNETKDTDWTKYLLPALRQFNLIGGSQVLYWGHLTFGESTYQRPSTDGNARASLCCYPDAVYPDKNSAIKAMGTSDSAESTTVLTEFPEGYTVDTWKTVEPDIIKELKSGKAPGIVAKDWGIPVAFMTTLKTKIG
jgi:hypothetical protein